MSIPVLPSSSPFTSEQRAWLNGFFAAVFGMDGHNAASNTSAGYPAPAPFVADEHSFNQFGPDSGVNGVSVAAPELEADESYPWHDPALSLDERMEKAEGRPLALRLMAAMAQLDCGQCGYVCKTYAQAIADGSEKSLRKCVPGEKPTANMLKELMASA